MSRQTATTFDAAATFFHLVNIWGEPDQETQQKIKYAKWNATRIAKAIKEGKDPNESNPKHDEPAQPPIDLNDPSLGQLGQAPPGTTPRPATVEDAPDVDSTRDAAGVSLPHTPPALTLPGVPGHIGQQPSGQPGYFDSHSMPSPVSPPEPNQPPYQPSPDSHPPPQTWTPSPPPQPSPSTFSPPPNDQPPHSHPPFAGPPTFATSPAPAPAVAPAPFNPPVNPSYTNVAPAAHSARQVVPPAAPPSGHSYAPPSAPSYAPPPAAHSYADGHAAGNFVADEASMGAAQKHAKWAISALNFEDVNTAVKELQLALSALGAR